MNPFRGLLRVSILSQLLVVAGLLAPGGVDSASISTNADPPVIPVASYSTIAPEDVEAHIVAIQGARSGTGSEAQRAKLAEVAGYIRGLLTGYGLSVSEDPVTFSGRTFPNIVGTLRGTTCPEKTFIVSAHYDGVSASPAADDDASGVAAVLEIARILSAQALPASVDFVAFSFEEQGMIGSSQMATAASSAGRELLGMINFDMIAYTCDQPGCQRYPEGIPPPRSTGDFVAVVGNTASHSLLESFTATSASAVPDLIAFPLEVAGNGETLPDVRRADHAPFWDHGYQALFVTDTADLRNPNYHQAGDTLDTLDLAFAAAVANASAATVVAVLTADENGDGRADVCGDVPVGGSAESPQPQSPVKSGDDGSPRNAVLFAMLAMAAIALLAVAGAWFAVRRRSRQD